MTMGNDDKSFYTLLVNISKDVGKTNASIEGLQEDIRELKANVEKNNSASINSVEKVSQRLEEYFKYAKDRQDNIKSELTTRIENCETRIDSIELKGKNKLWILFEKFKGMLIAAIFAAVIAYCMKFMSDLIKSLRPPEPNSRIEKTEVSK